MGSAHLRQGGGATVAGWGTDEFTGIQWEEEQVSGRRQAFGKVTNLACLAMCMVLASCAAGSGAAVIGGPGDQATTDPASRSVMDGVFTGPQAMRGQQGFVRNCGSCHAPSEFSGPIFQRIWNGRPVGGMYETVSISMPQNDPGGLTAAEYADIIAFFLRENGYPEGDEELPADRTQLNDLLFEPLP